MKIDIGTAEELGYALRPLKEVSSAIAADLLTTEAGRECGCCRKPFTAARKWESVGRVVHFGESGLMVTTWLLCRKCARDADGSVPEHMKSEARQAYEAARLMAVKAGGTA